MDYRFDEFKRVQEVLRKMAQEYKRVTNFIVPFFETIARFSSQIENAQQLFSSEMEKVIKATIRTQEMMKSALTGWQRFNRILFSLGWLPAGEWTLTHVNYIIEVAKLVQCGQGQPVEC